MVFATSCKRVIPPASAALPNTVYEIMNDDEDAVTLQLSVLNNDRRLVSGLRMHFL